MAEIPPVHAAGCRPDEGWCAGDCPVYPLIREVPRDPYEPQKASDGTTYIDFAAICAHELARLRAE